MKQQVYYIALKINQCIQNSYEKVSSFKLNLENILVPTSCLKRKTEKVNERKKRE